jgi:phage tail P2-like protein
MSESGIRGQESGIRKNLASSRVRTLLPPNTTDLEAAVAGCADEVRLAPEIISSLWNPATCPAANLPWLAWALSVDEWDDTWDVATQRRVIAASIEIHRKKGTVAAVKEALAILGHTGKLTEWWQIEPPGIPHTFLADVEIDNRGIDEAAIATIERQIHAVKPARSHFTMRLIGRSRCDIKVGIATLSGEDVSIYPYQITEIRPSMPTVHVGIGLHIYGSTDIYPRSKT